MDARTAKLLSMREPVKKAYKFPLIGVGEACQAHLGEEKKIVEAVKKKTCEDNKNLYVCEIHGPQPAGAYIGGKKVSGCQECYNAKRLKALKNYNETTIRITAIDKPWIMRWVKEEAKRLGVEKTEMLERILIERIPGEYIKAWYLSEEK
jgi:hypothetical protein